MDLKDPLAVVDSLDWTAMGAERWLASGTIAALGLLSVSAQVLYLRLTGVADPTTWFVSGIPLLLSVLVLGAALWLPRSEYGLLLPRIALWCVMGAVVLTAVGQLVILTQQSLGTEFGNPLFLLGYMQTAGTGIGLVIGLYDASSERTKRALDEQRERAERYSQQLSVLNRILRHDVRSGVQVIREYAGMLPDPPSMEPTIPVEHIRERAQDMYETAESARELEKLMGDRDRMTDRLEVVAEVESAVDVVETTYPDADIHIRADGSPEIAACKILDLAFKELITNAIEHTGDGSATVEVEVESTPQDVLVHIADEGPGIPDEELEPLRQGGETALVHSSGIGLWLANWIVQVTDGRLHFDATEGEGTTVTVRLPFEPAG